MKKHLNTHLLIVFLLFISLKVVSKDEVVIELKDIKITSLGGKFIIDSVIDLRTNKGDIGFAQVGLGNKKVPTRFVDSVDVYIKKYIDRNIQVKVANPQKIVLVIKHLWVGEYTGFSKEEGFAELSLDFCRLDANQNLVLLYRSSADVFESSMDVTSTHEKRIRETFYKSFYKFSALDSSLYNNILLSVLEDSTKILYKGLFTFKKGLYKNLSELLYNLPSDTTTAYTLKVKNNNEGKLSLPKTELDFYYAYCDGKDYWICNKVFSGNKKIVSRVIETGRFFLISAIVTDGGAMATGAMVGGLIGAAIANEASKVDGVILDIKTGKTFPLTYSSMDIILKDFPKLLNSLKEEKDKKKRSMLITYLRQANLDAKSQ